MKYLNYWILSFIFCSFVGTAYAAESDPPQLNAISVDKTVVDVSNGPQTVIFTTETYDASGIEWGYSWTDIDLNGPKYIRAISNEGIADVFTVTFDSNDPTGLYKINSLTLYDNNGVDSVYYSESLLSFGLPSHIEVIGENSEFDFDFDKNGTIDALTDGLLLLRYAFGLRGENLTNAAISSESTLTPQEVEDNIEQAASIADIDNNGSIDALTDGLLLLRYAFGLRNDNLVTNAVASDATRISAGNIEAYIEFYLPSYPSVILQPPVATEPLNITVNGVILESGTTNIIPDASVSFFEDGQDATNVLDIISGESISSVAIQDGSFQIIVDDIDNFTVVISASGYLDKTAFVEINEDAQIINVVLELIAEATEGVALAKEAFTDSIGEDFAVKAEAITLTSDDSAGEKTTEGQAEVAITGGIQFLDENDQVIEVAAVNLEVSYIETQEATDEDEEVLSIADVIPEGLNSDDTIDEVLVPVGVTEVNMTDENGTPIKNFSGNITITLYLPATTIDPATGNPITQASSFRVRTYDTETQVWTTEPEDAVTVLAQQGDLFPVEVTVDHLTIFVLTAEVTACINDVTFDFNGDAVPDTGLELFVEKGNLKSKTFIPPAANQLIIPADEAKNIGIMGYNGALYKVAIKDDLGNIWHESADGIYLCGNNTSIALAKPANNSSTP